MNPIDALFARLRAEKRKAFIPFLTAGDPDLPGSMQIVRDVATKGASLIEIGFPYSDPIADGSVIQASYTRALNKGIRIDDIFASIHELSQEKTFANGSVPLVSMVSYSLVYHRGLEKFVEDAQKAGLSGAIIPDLPVDESQRISNVTKDHDFKLIHLVTPVTPRERASRIAKVSTGFLYYVSVVGITGERTELSSNIVEQLDWLRRQTDVPICVGFGINRSEQVKMLRDHVDGVIVGSALVRKLSDAGPLNDARTKIAELVESLSSALNA